MQSRYLGWVVFIFALITLLVGIFNPEPFPRLFHNADKYEHLVAFAVVPFLGARYIQYRPLCVLYWFVWCALAYGLEYGQGAFLPKRTFDLYDVYANLGGVFVAFLVWFCLSFFYKKLEFNGGNQKKL